MYEYLGSWAIADQGLGIKAAPFGLCFTRRRRRISDERPLLGWTRPSEGGLRDRHKPDDDWYGQSRGDSGGLVRHGQRQQKQPAKQAIG
jgi:hypothetical protein